MPIISIRHFQRTLLAFSLITGLTALGLFARSASRVVIGAPASLIPVFQPWIDLSSASRVVIGAPASSSASRVAETQDVNDLLVLHFDNTLNGENGETPTQASGVTFAAGVSGQGVQVDSGDVLKYATAGNFNAPTGSIEFWIKPLWNGSDTTARYFFSVGNNQLLLVKDGGNNFRFLLKSDDSEAFQGYNLGSWVANQWHHVAVTWSVPGRMKTYFDGTKVLDHSSANQDLISPVPADMTFGGNNGATVPTAVIDEFRLSDIERTPQEIASRMAGGLTVGSWSLNPATASIEMYPGWFYWTPLSISAVTNIGTLALPVLVASWSSSNQAVAVMDPSGQFKALSPGAATLTGTLGGQQNSVAINVLSPVLPPVEEAIEPFMATPASGYLYRMPVVIIRYFPTRDGINLDAAAAGVTSTLAALKSNVEQIERRHKFMLEEGSKFRGYGNATAPPSLGYQVIKTITVYEDIPPGFGTGTAGVYFPDYNQILTRFNAQNLVNNLGVKEFWIVHYHNGRIAPVESNMSSPTTGDISNSSRTNGDQPIYDKTYVTYGLNFTRSQAEATHNHGHQLESILSNVNQRQDGNTTLWWQQFARAANNPPARAGNTHFPPNALVDYDYTNLNLVASDIMDWRPAGGTTTLVNANTWGNVPYAWPGGVAPPQEVESKWYVFWFQSMAGRGNTIPYNTNKMTNWWQFTGDWDAAIQAGLGLYEPASCTYTLGATTQAAPMAGGTYTVGVSCGSGCKWFASSNQPWLTVTGGRTGNGNGTVTINVAQNDGTAARTGTIAFAGEVFTITQAGHVATPLASILKAFSPTTIAAGGTSTVTLTLSNPSSVGVLASFTDTLTNMSAVGGAIGSTCATLSSITIPANATNLSLSGIVIPANGSCVVTFPVRSTVVGTHPNTTSGVTTDQSPIAGAPSNTANLTVTAATTMIAKAFSPTTIMLGGISTVTLTLSNTLSLGVLASFTDTLTNMTAVGGPIGGTCATLSGVTLVANATNLSFNGIVIPGNGSCMVSFGVRGTVAGVQSNTTSGVTTDQTPVAGTVSNTATLTVVPTTIAKAFNPTTIVAGGRSTVTLTLTNNNPSGVLASFTDALTNMTAVGGPIGSTCGTLAAITIPANATNLNFSGIVVPGNGSCAVSFAVTSNTVGTHPNTTSGVTMNSSGIAGPVSNTAMLTVSGARPTTLASRAVRNDFDGDGKSDLALWRADLGEWQVKFSSDGELHHIALVEANDKDEYVAVAADFDGDHKTDAAVWCASDGRWLIKYSLSGELVKAQYGLLGDVPMPADYDGDGRADLAVWRKGDGWHIQRSRDQTEQALYLGQAGDVPVVGDFDGDGSTDVAMFRASEGRWLLRDAATGALSDVQFGQAGDVPFAADFDGDGQDDLMVLREGMGYVRRSVDQTVEAAPWGSLSAGAAIVLGDYDGDGRAEPATWRLSDGVWWIFNSATKTFRRQP